MKSFILMRLVSPNITKYESIVKNTYSERAASLKAEEI